jgi:hypothetical protein
MASKVPKINANTNLVQYFLNIESPRFEDWCFSYSEKYPLTKSLLSKAQIAWHEATNIRECQRQERVNRRKAASVERAKAELEAALEEVKKTLPEMLEQIRERIEHELELATKPFQWSEIDHPLVNGEWSLHYNNYECWKELSTEVHNESPDGMRSGGLYSVWKVVEKGAGSYWTNSISGSKEFFVSRAKSQDEPVPEVIYPHCTIQADEYKTSDLKDIMWHKEQALQKRQRAKEWVEEAEKALADVNLKWIVYNSNYPLYNRICRAIRAAYQLNTQNEINSKVREVLSNLLVQ